LLKNVEKMEKAWGSFPYKGENMEQGGCGPIRSIPIFYKDHTRDWQEYYLTTDDTIEYLMEVEKDKFYAVRKASKK